MNNLKLSIIYFLILFISVNCKSDLPEKVEKKRATNQPFVKDVPMENGKEEFLYKAIKEDIKKRGLANLENGFDSIYIRIWLDWDALLRQRIISISKSSNEWHVEKCLLIYNNNNNDVRKICQEEIIKLKLDGLPEYIEEAGLYSLPHMSKIPGYRSGADGENDIIEISTANSYKLIYYWSPESYEDKFEEVKRWQHIKSYLENRLDFRRN